MTPTLSAARSDMRRLAAAIKPVILKHKRHQQLTPELPEGRVIQVGNRGRLFMRHAQGPKDAIPVVLLHGWTWTADLCFSGVFKQLAEHHPIIAPDLRLHGQGISGDGHFKLQTATDDIIALLDELKIERAIFCGFSLGGIITADAVTRHPERVAGIHIQSSAACYNSSPRERFMLRALQVAKPFAELPFTGGLSSRYLNASLRKNPRLAKHWKWAKGELSKTSTRNIITVGEEVERLDLRPSLKQPIHCPGEYLLLAHDRICRKHMQRDLAKRLGLPIVELKTDHDLPVAQPELHGQVTVQAIRRIASAIN